MPRNNNELQSPAALKGSIAGVGMVEEVPALRLGFDCTKKIARRFHICKASCHLNFKFCESLPKTPPEKDTNTGVDF